VQTYLNIGQIYIEQEELDKALPHYEKANELAPQTPSIQKALAQVLQQQKNLAKAKELYYAVLDKEESDLDSMVQLAAIEQEEGNLAKAKNLYERVIAIAPFHPEAKNALEKLA
jgi:cytochrome c-type biogenesis protein CcmH/NrfG